MGLFDIAHLHWVICREAASLPPQDQKVRWLGCYWLILAGRWFVYLLGPVFASTFTGSFKIVTSPEQCTALHSPLTEDQWLHSNEPQSIILMMCAFYQGESCSHSTEKSEHRQAYLARAHSANVSTPAGAKQHRHEAGCHRGSGSECGTAIFWCLASNPAAEINLYQTLGFPESCIIFLCKSGCHSGSANDSNLYKSVTQLVKFTTLCKY